ncbi:ShlB/FhaC/HecB family hemolysin secretion/activation protein [Haloferula sp.]|uniref:ShlB/FhaC/HecB family hemolysin secretion/activation protein n=1 Tax=Haloferula sp. TaxID=2497595 RepID=UPI00329C15F3
MFLCSLPLVAVDEEPVAEPEDESEGLLPLPGELDFLAVPFEEVAEPVNRRVVESFDLPAVDRYLPPRARAIPSVEVRGFRFEGNTVFKDAELEETINGFRGRKLIQEDLDSVRFRLTELYVSNGYLNSGARIPDQDLADGVLEIQITEGRLSDVITTGNEELSDRYLSSRILVHNDRPLHFPTLQRRLQVMQSNPNIGRLNAELKPGLAPGEALMTLEVEEAPKWSYGVDLHNQRSPSVGGEQMDLWLENRNVSGYSDTFRARLGVFSGNPDELEFAGLDNVFLQYERPILADDTSLLLAWQTEDYSILEEPFRSLFIDGESWSMTGGFRRPLYRTLQDEVWLSLMLEKSHDETYLLGRPFSISPGSVNGELDLSILRLGADWTRRTRKSVLAMRTALSLGFDGLGATSQLTEPDGQFFTWTVDGQYSRRVHDRGDLVVLHGGFQFSNDPLPPPAQMRVGGRYTVRGYRENFLVRDNGFYGGVDYQFPLLLDGENGGWSLWAVPFVDAGIGWNDNPSMTESLISVGVGLKASYSNWFRGELFWGIPLKNEGQASGNIQDDGIHFRMSFARF